MNNTFLTLMNINTDRKVAGRNLIYEAADLCSKLDEFTDIVRDLEGLQRMYPKARRPQHDEIMAYFKVVLDDGRRETRMVQALTQSGIGPWLIEASQRSIDETLSVKRLTQLALIFIPLSFVTSLYGISFKGNLRRWRLALGVFGDCHLRDVPYPSRMAVCTMVQNETPPMMIGKV